jgi:hypothetical protein
MLLHRVRYSYIPPASIFEVYILCRKKVREIPMGAYTIVTWALADIRKSMHVFEPGYMRKREYAADVRPQKPGADPVTRLSHTSLKSRECWILKALMDTTCLLQ